MKLMLKSKLTEYEREATRIEARGRSLFEHGAGTRASRSRASDPATGQGVLKPDGSELREVDSKIDEFEERKVTRKTS